MEANPTSVEGSKLKNFREAGINRLSLGVQSLRDSDLRYLGRNHTTSEAISAYELARNTFPRVSFDLIYGRHSGQTVDGWSEELQEALSLKPDHLSLYTLTIEPNTPYYRLHSKATPPDRRLSLPDLAVQEALYHKTVELTKREGLGQYEVSNFAREGQESRHNMNYWSYGLFLGIGAGAASRVALNNSANDRWALKQLLDPNKWMLALENNSSSSLEETQLTPEEILWEVLLLSLRTTQGLPSSRLSEVTGGLSFDQVINLDIVRELEKEGILSFESDRLLATSKGLALLDSVLPQLINNHKVD
eukprot:TRINITY_DN1333_c0_g1_i2.p1 TRINITY_DN1333_c0_g1~~TRINITY_DN1333_c0_g1_i2.p1  ORF type:complete len:305 (+),score=60.97 TRINITY_DN1333_c0_g1_i2:420-1334(+)